MPGTATPARTLLSHIAASRFGGARATVSRRALGAKASRGFTMVEILVALLVLSIGLLGVAALQLTSLRSNHAAAMRSQATFLAYDIIDRMRANRDGALKGQYDIDEASSGTAGTVSGNDLIAWKDAIARTLPGVDRDNDGTLDPATGSVTRNGNVFTVGIVWGDLSDDPANTTGKRTLVHFDMQTQLNN